ncbi:MAG: aminotransferase class I/II-fold pyridoxal phosphate-dependent enzyme, partial [Acidobacteria bacterium]|nr:aminotransferase class I/II-fold pyridoxal phosphate-dependent enzyme [Acidobacteriota bacterium]
EGESSYDDVRYIRLNNSPNHHALQAKLSQLEGAETALVTSSGMAAISTALLAHLQPGDHILVQDNLYGGTHELMWRTLPSLGIAVDAVDVCNPGSWAEKRKPSTRLFYVESMSNPLLRVGALDRVVAFSRQHGLLSFIDNTFASPINFKPIPFGFDVSLHSATKYLNGHSDLVAGACIGRAEVIEPILKKLNILGGCLDPHAAFLLERGIKTLALRVEAQNRNGLAIATYLANHPKIEQVFYPGLSDHPDHARATTFFTGYGGMLSFTCQGGAKAAAQVVASTQLAACAPSLGGVESLITRPASTSHACLTAQERHALGIGDNLIRYSVGIEDGDDLIADLDQALAQI